MPHRRLDVGSGDRFTAGMANALKPNVSATRQLFLYGNGDGKRILSIPALQKLTGCHPDTIRKHLPAWEKEAEKILINSNDSCLAFSLSEESLAAHESDMIFLRDNISQIKWEMDNLDNVIEKLETICGNFSLNTENGDDAIKLFDRYLRASLNKANLRGQFLAAQKQWTSLSGIVDLKDIQVVRQREIAKGKGKMDLKKLEAEENQGPKNITRTGVFARPALEAGE